MKASRAKFTEAEPLFQTCLQRRSQALGDSHGDTMRTMMALADTLEHLGKYNEAEECLDSCLIRRDEVFGDNHADTLETMYRLSVLLEKRDKVCYYHACQDIKVEVDFPPPFSCDWAVIQCIH